jgi:hypothetical protein
VIRKIAARDTGIVDARSAQAAAITSAVASVVLRCPTAVPAASPPTAARARTAIGASKSVRESLEKSRGTT